VDLNNERCRLTAGVVRGHEPGWVRARERVVAFAATDLADPDFAGTDFADTEVAGTAFVVTALAGRGGSALALADPVFAGICGVALNRAERRGRAVASAHASASSRRVSPSN